MWMKISGDLTDFKDFKEGTYDLVSEGEYEKLQAENERLKQLLSEALSGLKGTNRDVSLVTDIDQALKG